MLSRIRLLVLGLLLASTSDDCFAAEKKNKKKPDEDLTPSSQTRAAPPALTPPYQTRGVASGQVRGPAQLNIPAPPSGAAALSMGLAIGPRGNDPGSGSSLGLKPGLKPSTPTP